jgi:hypothetical protein
MSAPVLLHANQSKPFIIEADASDFALEVSCRKVVMMESYIQLLSTLAILKLQKSIKRFMIKSLWLL